MILNSLDVHKNWERWKDVKDEVVETSGYDVKLFQCILDGNINNVGSSHNTELIRT